MTKLKSRKLKPETRFKKAKAIDVELLSELEGKVIDFSLKNKVNPFEDCYNGIVGRVGELYVEMHCVSMTVKDTVRLGERLVYSKDLIGQFRPTVVNNWSDVDTYRKLYEEDKWK